ncbi:MAG TPA: MotA/TolQ/ExbB proton channel family protein [Candidatus Tectomicrobia bacterium]|nr:MotA/TolQ/ExbB proton channel family protein [Candidatus Tectomicrobia bacterium]
MIEWLIKGGPVMAPLLLCSVISLSIIVERSLSLRRNRILRYDILQRIEELLRDRKIPEASTLCKRYPSSMTRILLAAILNHDKSRQEIKEIIEDAGRQEVPVLERYLTILGTIASIAVLLGLLGTVTGMIRTFNAIAALGYGHPEALAGGISEALVATATGLAIAIPTLVLYNFFTSKVDSLVIEMEKNSLRMLSILKRD